MAVSDNFQPFVSSKIHSNTYQKIKLTNLLVRSQFLTKLIFNLNRKENKVAGTISFELRIKFKFHQRLKVAPICLEIIPIFLNQDLSITMDSIVVYLFLTFSLLLVDINHLTELCVSNTSARKIKHFIFCCTANMYSRFWDAAKNDFINIQPPKRGFASRIHQHTAPKSEVRLQGK